MIIYLVMAEHHTVPGLIQRAFAKETDANRFANEIANIALKDGDRDIQLWPNAPQWERADIMKQEFGIDRERRTNYISPKPRRRFIYGTRKVTAFRHFTIEGKFSP